MERIKLLIGSIRYSVILVYTSSKLMILLALVLSLIGRTIPFANMYVMKNIIDELAAKELNISAIVIYISLYSGILLLGSANLSANSIISNSISQKAGHKYDIELSEKLAKLPMSVIDTSAGKDLVDEIKYAKYEATGFAQEIIGIVSMVYSFCIAFVALAVFNIWFSLLFLLLSVPIIVFEIVFDRKSEALRRKMAPDVRKFSYYRWMLTNMLPAKDVRMYDLTEPIKKRYDTEKNIYRRENKALDLKKLRFSLFIEIIKRSGEIMFTIFVIFQATSGKITIGDIALYIGFALSVNDSFKIIASRFALWYTTFADRMKIFFEFNKIDCTDEIDGKRTLGKFESLTFENVYFKYPFAEKYVLQGTSFTLKNGDKLSIVGINGAGKSTIIKLMLGLYPFESGQIFINGYPMSDYNMKDIRKMFSVFFQNFVRYPLTLRENIKLSNLDSDGKNDDEKIIEALKQSGIYENYDKFENGLNSYMTRKFDNSGIELSIGQWQKIALSRAYFKNAAIIIFDEPSAALDAEAENKIFENFENMSENKTGIMISHRISSAKISSKVIVLDGGKISESGTHEELIALDGLYANLYNLQMEKYTIKEAKLV